MRCVIVGVLWCAACSSGQALMVDAAVPADLAIVDLTTQAGSDAPIGDFAPPADFQAPADLAAPADLTHLPSWSLVDLSGCTTANPGYGHFVRVTGNAAGDYYIGTSDRICRSVDGGATFRSPVYVAWLQDVWAGGSDVYAVDVEYVRSSHDHGASWSAHDYVGNPASNSLYGVFAAGADVWAVGDSGTGQGSILHSSDSGATWGWMTPPLVAGIPLLGVWASGALVVAKYGGGGIRSTDQGATWSAIGPLVCGYGFYVIGASATDVWTGDSEHACDNGSPPGHAVAVHSTDGALTWSSTFAPANASVHEVWTSAGEVFAVGTSYSPTAKTPSLWHSPDDGATWTPIPGPVTRFPAISFDHVWATAADDLWVVDSNQNIYRFH